MSYKINYDEYTEVIEKELKKVRDMIISKGKEYATDADPLHNFRAATSLLNGDMKKVLAGYMMKHTVSIYDMIQNSDVTNPYPVEKWEEKITDHIIYLLILRACVMEEDMNRTDLCRIAQNSTQHNGFFIGSSSVPIAETPV